MESEILAAIACRATPFQPVLELLRDYFGLRSKQAADVSRRIVLDRLATLPVSEQLPAILLDFLGIADPQRPAIRLDPKTRKTQLLDFVRVLPRSPREPASVVIVEDLHWIDAASQTPIYKFGYIDATLAGFALMNPDMRNSQLPSQVPLSGACQAIRADARQQRRLRYKAFFLSIGAPADIRRWNCG